MLYILDRYYSTYKHIYTYINRCRKRRGEGGEVDGKWKFLCSTKFLIDNYFWNSVVEGKLDLIVVCVISEIL